MAAVRFALDPGRLADPPRAGRGGTLTLFGFVLGLAQWLVLRGQVRPAGWWVAVNAATPVWLPRRPLPRG